MRIHSLSICFKKFKDNICGFIVASSFKFFVMNSLKVISFDMNQVVEKFVFGSFSWKQSFGNYNYFIVKMNHSFSYFFLFQLLLIHE